MNIQNIEVVAKLTLYSTENGGRKTPIASKYRPNHVFEYFDNSKDYITTYIGQIEFEQDLLYPDETCIVKVIFINDRNIEDFITKDRVWWIHEGAQKMGEAKILEIIT